MKYIMRFIMLRALIVLCYKTSSLPFKGKGTLEAEQRVRVGMGRYCRYYPIPIPAP